MQVYRANVLLKLFFLMVILGDQSQNVLDRVSPICLHW